MESLLQSKKIRDQDRLRAQDVKTRRERENEGDEFADKEAFITSAYKAQQEEMARIAQEENQGKYYSFPTLLFANSCN